MHAYYSDTFVLPLPATHRFPMAKYRLLRERLLAERVLAPAELRVPDAIGWDALGRAHDAGYLAAVATGSLSGDAQRRIGFPWSPALVERSRRSVGATLAAAQAALADGVAVNLAGGTHHAFAGHGAGYCVFNDVAVAARVLQQQEAIARAVVFDCDVHQGDGTAAIFAADPAVFTVSFHGANNFPFRKQCSRLDVPFADGAGDDEYLAALDRHLPAVLDAFGPDLVFYLAGADPYAGDRLGRLRMTIDGLRERDRRVFNACRTRAVPVAITMAGGYASDVADTVTIHANTIREAVRSATHRARTQGAGVQPEGPGRPGPSPV